VGGPHAPPLVADADWLWEHRDDAGLRLVDCGSIECGTSDVYERVHLPGALHLPTHGWLKQPELGVHVVGPEEFSRIMTSIGGSHDTTVVVYDDYNSSYAARLWWVLTYYGHPDVRILNGGFRRWFREGRPLSDEPVVSPEGSFEAQPDPSMIVDLEYVRGHLADPDVQIVNALWEDWYSGEVTPSDDARPGHIPGSVNMPVERFLAGDGDVSFRPVEQVQQVVDEAGLDPTKETVLHCWAGVRTTLAYFSLARLGWTRLRAYDASLAEWARRDDTPLEVG
jgi:thiosulfate/3-mercaptopyruvate sulfurtransferase